MKKAWHWIKTKLGHRKTYVAGTALIAWTWMPYVMYVPYEVANVYGPVWYTLAILVVFGMRSGMSRGPR